MKKQQIVEVVLDKIVGGGQALGTLPDGRKLFAWGGIPGERVSVQITKKKSSYAEGVVVDVLQPSPERISPRDPESYLSTSPWQIMSFAAEQRYKAQLIHEAFELHDIDLPEPVEVYSNNQEYHYRNKVEFSWYGDASSGAETLHLAFFRRGSKGKIVVDDSALLPSEMMHLARTIRDYLQTIGVSARQLKTLLIRCDAERNCVWQLYVKDTPCDFADALIQTGLPAQGGEVIYSNPKSPASVITERLASTGNATLKDTILDVPFRYATEGFFQVNLPVYEQALKDMREWVNVTAIPPSSLLSPLPSSASSISAVSPPPAPQTHVPRARNFANANQFASEDSLAQGHRPCSRPAPTTYVLLRSGGKPESSEQAVASGWPSAAEGKRVTRGGAAPVAKEISSSDFLERGADRVAGPAPSDLRANSERIGDDGSGNGISKNDVEMASKMSASVLDLYSGVGSIGLTIGGPGVTLVEINEHAVREMKRNIQKLGIDATPMLAASEQALDHITSDRIVIVDPPRAGLHADVINKLLLARPPRIIYLSCNPVTQARDIALLASGYTIRTYKGYNFFPRTPHIEGLAILDKH